MANTNPVSERAAYAAQWRITGPLLAAQAWAEVRSLSLIQRQQQIDSLLDLAARFGRPRRDDGLVRLQAVLRRLHQANRGRS